MERERYRVDDLVVDVDSARVHRGNNEVPLPGLSMDLLVELARSAPKMVSADELILRVWKGVAVADETLTQRVALLRRALGDSAKNPRYVRSIRGRGYILAATVVPLAEEAPPPSSVLPTGVPAPNPWAWRVLAGAAVLGLLLLLAALQFSRRTAEPLRTAAPTAEELLLRAEDYLARHQERDNERAVALYRRVLARKTDHVDALVGLSLALSQRVTKFNHPLAGVDEALTLANRALTLAPNSASAHRARAAALGSHARVREALAAYQRAAALDPEMVAAVASEAYLLWVQGRLAEALETNLSVADSADVLPYLDLQMASTLASLGFEPAAVVWFEKAMELRSESVFAGSTFAMLRLRQGRFADAEQLVHQAQVAGVRQPELPLILGHISLLRGRDHEAEGHYSEALALNPTHSQAKTRLLILKTQTGDPPSRLIPRYEQAIEELRRAREAGDEWPTVAIDEALLHTAFGKPEAALQALDAAIDLGYREADWLLLDPMLAPLRDHPAFFSRIEQIRLAVASEREKVLQAAWLPPHLLRP